ncbi:hypothetical protein BJ322DRAFT_1102092 [Thelephora terrestris]|uniref:Ubiquitin-like 1-activating enzyme E1A n=1 Tax=Thelephora terrestris TaxID=56493 RepID=A0A9P6H3R0_9AGAM|nr:hypothetical protein BJ322DRAFT_1102092 [Thelephora terrestris]
MSSHAPGDGAPVQITEDEAALYDRQIRLWGLEAQQRMRNATILVLTIRGLATEVVKNIVLAGVGKLIIADNEEVKEEDLGTGFFFRDEDVGRKRVDAARPRVESLNPLVAIEAVSEYSDESLVKLIEQVDLVCMTEETRENIVRLNETCRSLGKKFYAGGVYGLLGYIFCDLQEHEFISPDRSGKKDAKNVKLKSRFTSLREALEWRWNLKAKREAKEINPHLIFTLLALWEFQQRHEGELPSQMEQAAELESIQATLINERVANKSILKGSSEPLIASLSTTAAHEFSPVCAVVGGALAQDILNALSARESPVSNLFVFDGMTGSGHTAMLMNPPSS